MLKGNKRTAFLGCASVSVMTLSMLAASPASAVCAIANNVKTCGTTTTSDTTGAGFIDRNTVFFGGGTTLNVVSGSVVSGFGLAVTDTGNPFSLTVNNHGSVQVNSGNVPSAGGSNAALFVSSSGAPVTYGGAGVVSHLGTGNALEIAATGAASITANIGGAVGVQLNREYKGDSRMTLTSGEIARRSSATDRTAGYGSRRASARPARPARY